MKKSYLSLLILFLGVFTSIKCQDNKISFQGGLYYPITQLKNEQLGCMGGFDLTHIFNNNMTLSSHFTLGKDKYREEEFTNVPPQWQEISQTNAEMYLYNIGLLVGKVYPFSEKWNFWFQGGLALSLLNKENIPLALLDTDIINPTYQYGIHEMNFSLPFQTGINYRILDQMELGDYSGLLFSQSYCLSSRSTNKYLVLKRGWK